MKIKSGYKLKSIAGETVLFMQGHAGVDMTKIISFNDTSEWLWNTLYGKDFTEDDVAELIVKHYGIDERTAREDAGRWIVCLSNVNLIET
ncbi:hypothetical protein FACS189420_7790 [Bacteroidia bacterium]|nr:hypothetical protein FACS189420_7790 [Bacteroidia bacterium]